MLQRDKVFVRLCLRMSVSHQSSVRHVLLHLICVPLSPKNYHDLQPHHSCIHISFNIAHEQVSKLQDDVELEFLHGHLFASSFWAFLWARTASH